MNTYVIGIMDSSKPYGFYKENPSEQMFLLEDGSISKDASKAKLFIQKDESAEAWAKCWVLVGNERHELQEQLRNQEPTFSCHIMNRI